MGQWEIDTHKRPGVLWLCLKGNFTVAEMDDFVHAHNRAVALYAGQPYRVFCDLRELLPLSPEAAELFTKAKDLSAARHNFEGSAVLVRNHITGLQHHRTSVIAGVANTELSTDDEKAAWKHLETVRRSNKGR